MRADCIHGGLNERSQDNRADLMQLLHPKCTSKRYERRYTSLAHAGVGGWLGYMNKLMLRELRKLCVSLDGESGEFEWEWLEEERLADWVRDPSDSAVRKAVIDTDRAIVDEQVAQATKWMDAVHGVVSTLCSKHGKRPYNQTLNGEYEEGREAFLAPKLSSKDRKRKDASQCNGDIGASNPMILNVLSTRMRFGIHIEAMAHLLSQLCHEGTDIACGLHGKPVQTRTSLTAQMSQFMHGSMCAAIWTSCHAHAIANLEWACCAQRGANASARESDLCDMAAPSIAVPINAMSLPNVDDALYSSLPNAAPSKNLMDHMLTRSINPASRGWSTAYENGLTGHPGVQIACFETVLVACTGMHSCIFPHQRPGWKERMRLYQALQRPLSEALRKRPLDISDVVKESVRCCLAMSYTDSTSLRNAITNGPCSHGFFMHAPPERLPIDGMTRCLSTICSAASAVCCQQPTSLSTDRLCSAFKSINMPSWVGRGKATPLVPSAMEQTQSLVYEGFGVEFSALWLHSVRCGHRAQRLDISQYDSLHKSNLMLQMIESVCHTKEALSLQRLAMKSPGANHMSLRELVTFMREKFDDRVTGLTAQHASTTSLEHLPAHAIALVMCFGRVAWMRNQVRIVHLGAKTRFQNSMALSMIYDVIDLVPSDLSLQGCVDDPHARCGLVDDAARDGKVLRLTKHRLEHMLATASAPDFATLMRACPATADEATRTALQDASDLMLCVSMLPTHSTHLCVCLDCRRVANSIKQAPRPTFAKIGEKNEFDPMKSTKNSSAKQLLHELGIKSAMVDSLETCKGTPVTATGRETLYCAKRSSAALKAALNAVSQATAACVERKEGRLIASASASRSSHVDGMPSKRAKLVEVSGQTDTAQSCSACPDEQGLVVEDDGLHEVREDAKQSSLSRLRRDSRRCYDQRRVSKSCGIDRMLTIDCLGRAVHVMGHWYALCSYCGSFVAFKRESRLGVEIACQTCISDSLRTPNSNAAPAYSTELRSSTLAMTMDDVANVDELNIVKLCMGARTASYMRERDVDKACRACGKMCTRRGRSFVAYYSPLDRKGINNLRPPELRVTRWCPCHNRSWLPNALRVLTTNVILCHIDENARPVHI